MQKQIWIGINFGLLGVSIEGGAAGKVFFSFSFRILFRENIKIQKNSMANFKVFLHSFVKKYKGDPKVHKYLHYLHILLYFDLFLSFFELLYIT